MFCFTTQSNQNIKFERPRKRGHSRLSMSRNTGLEYLNGTEHFPITYFPYYSNKT